MYPHCYMATVQWACCLLLCHAHTQIDCQVQLLARFRLCSPVHSPVCAYLSKRSVCLCVFVCVTVLCSSSTVQVSLFNKSNPIESLRFATCALSVACCCIIVVVVFAHFARHNLQFFFTIPLSLSFTKLHSFACIV